MEELLCLIVGGIGQDDEDSEKLCSKLEKLERRELSARGRVDGWYRQHTEYRVQSTCSADDEGNDARLTGWW